MRAATLPFRLLVTFAVSLTGALLAPPAHAAWPVDGTPLCAEIHPQSVPVLASDGAQGAIVVWTDSRFSSYNVYAQRVDSLGVPQWSIDGVTVCSAVSDQIQPAAVSVPGGGAVVFWQDYRDGSFSDIYAQRIDGQGLPQWAFNGIPLGAGADREQRPMAVSDGAGSVIGSPGWNVVWTNTDDVGEMGLYAQHVNATGGGLWTPAFSGGIAIKSTSNATISSAVIASDGVGTVNTAKGAVVAWAQINSPNLTDRDIYARRIDAGGVAQWGAPQLICGLSGYQSNPAIANVGGAQTVIAWEDVRNGDYDIYVQKLNSSGVPQWLADGLPVCRALGQQANVQIVSDLSGGAIVTWEDSRSGVQKIYAQHINASGQPLWAVDGIPLCSGAGIQRKPQIIGDGALGAIVAWEDLRGPKFDIYAQRVNANGALLWASSGAPLGAASGDQDFVSIISDTRNGALVTWRDHREGDTNTDIYANRAFASGGTVDAPAEAAPSNLRVAFVSSNPSRGDVRMRLELPEAAHVTADILDAQGRRVRTLHSGTSLGAGSHLLTWDGADDSGAVTGPGVFFVRVRAGAETLTTRVVALR